MFDVDKLYIMLPEFRIRKYNMRQAREDYAKENAIFKEVLSKFTISELAEDILNADIDDFKEWFKENKEKYRFAKPIISKVKYDFSKSPQENSLEARNNLLIDMMYGVLTNTDTASKILNPGNFDYQRRAARILTILNSSSEKELAQALKNAGVELNKTVQKGGRSYPKSIASYLFDLDLDTLDKLAEKIKVKMDPLSPRTQVILHQQNMTGAKLIGIYANHNANHALMQHTQLALNEKYGSFVLNGKRLTSLHDIMNANKEFISKNNAGFLAASVDNVKDPVLAALNQNTFTADASMLLSRLGYNPIEIGLLMMQPIVQEITQTYFREAREGKGKDTIIDEILNKYREKAALNRDLTYDNYKSNNFYIEDLADNIIIAKTAINVTDRSQTSDFREIEFYSKQVAVGFLFKRIMNSAEALKEVVQATKADTQGGAAGPTIADTELKIQKVEDLLIQIDSNDKYPLDYANVIDSSLWTEDVNIDTLRNRFLTNSLPFLQAFYTLGVESTTKFFEPYFPQLSQPFRDVVDKLRDKTKTGKLNVKTMNNIYNDLLAYIMSKTEFFGSSLSINPDSEMGNTIITSSIKRKNFINNFPKYFKKVVTENEDIASLEFIKRLKVIREDDHNPVPTVVFKNVGRLSPTLRERYMRDWASLLYMSNPEAQKLALNLFRYSYYRNGFAFGPSTFIHLAPVAVRKAIPEYINTLRSILTSNDDYSQFIDQYIYNHLNNRKFVPEISDKSSVKFVDKDNKIRDTVIFVINDESSFEDKKVVKQIIKMGEDTIYEFMEYICKREKGKNVYYRLTSHGFSKAVYNRIEPLGFKNSFIEYEYGKNADEIETVIDNNKKDYDPHADSLARFVFEDAEIDDDMDNSYVSELSDDYLDNIFNMVYGEPLDNPTSETDDITAIQPNTEYRDENGDSICGAPILYSL